MSQLQVTGEAKIRDIQGPVVANSGVITALDGAASQYVRGDGTLADFPTSTGGGSSVSYYLNSSVSQGTIDGVAYRELSKEPIIGAGTDITISANGYVASYITDANDPDVLSVPGGNFNCEFYFSVNNNTGNPTTYAELYKYDGTTFTLLGSSQAVPESLNQGTTIAPYYFAIPVATAALALTDRLAIRIYVSVDGRVVTLHTENSHLCQVVTTFSKGMVSLNNLTDQSQFITTGTSGTNFNIVSSGDTHTFNLPVASATNTGKLSSTDWSTFNAKQPAGNYVTLDTTQTITAAKTISGLLTVNNKIYLQTDLSTTGVYLQSYNSNEFSIGVTSGATTYYSDFILQGANRYYTFPNIDGTIALLEGTQTFSGAKTFSLDILVNGLTIGRGAGSISTNTVVGSSALAANTTGYGNTSIGLNNLIANTTGFFNVAIGASSLISNTTGTYNAALGTSSLYNNTTGSNNTAVGQQAGESNATGSNNTYIGWGSGYGIQTGSNNTIIGAYTGTAALANNIVLADGAGNVRYRYDGTNNNLYGNVNFSSTIGNGTYTYTLPAASGTLALTSDINYPVTSVFGRTGAVVAASGDYTTTQVTEGTNLYFTNLRAQNAITLTTTGTSGAATYSGGTLNIPQYQGVLTNPVTGTGTTNTLPKFTGASVIGNSLLTDNGTTLSYNGNIVLNAGNYNSYAPSLTGGGASGTWAINISGTAAAASSVAWGNVTSKPSLIMYYQSFTLDANTMDSNSTGFTYANNAPYTGPIARFSAGGSYDLQLNASYGGGTSIAYRTRNGDVGAWNSWYALISTANIGAQSVNYANTAGNTNSVSSATGGSYTWTNIQYFLTNNGGQAVNNSNSAILQAYSTGGNSAFMSFHRAGYYAVNFGLDNDNYMRIGGWSAPANRWILNTASGDCTLSGWQSAADFYTTGWFRAYGNTGLYQQDYGGHLRRVVNAAHGTWELYGYTKNGYNGINVLDAQGYNNNLMFENGQGGIYSDNGSGWIFYLARPNDCVGINGSETYDWVRACTNGKHRFTNDTWCDATAWAYTFSNISDGRLKENIFTVDSALDKVLQLRGVYYNWIIDTENIRHIGLIAQETAEVCPEVVNYHEETDTYSVNYSELGGLFVEATKELNQKLIDANARIELLEAKINQLLNS